MSDDFSGTHSSEFEVDLKQLSGRQTDQALADIGRMLQGFSGAAFSVNTFLTERINEILSGYTGTVVVNVYGPDLNELDNQAVRVAAVLAKTPGAREVQIQSPPGMPQVMVRLRPSDVARWGFDSVQVLDVLQTAFSGDVIGQVYEDNQVFPVSVILNPTHRQSVSAIASLPIRSSQENYVPVRQLADVYQSSGRYMISHIGARRVQSVPCNVAGGDVASFVATARQRISRLALPSGMHVEFSGTGEEQARSQRDSAGARGPCRDWHHHPALDCDAELPQPAVGSGKSSIRASWWRVRGACHRRQFITGLIGRLRHGVRHHPPQFHHADLTLRTLNTTRGVGVELGYRSPGASERLSPILMTALVTALGLLPLAIGSGAPGREVEGPMAILIILGGLATSTVLNLLVLPTLALHYGDFERTDAMLED